MTSKGSVLAAMSGGVDSSVAAMLLKDAGWRVSGATLRLFGNDIPGGEEAWAPHLSTGKRCCSLSDVLDAKEVSQKLDIYHLVHNFSLLFRREVIDRFINAYRSGRTPNPCIDCNRRVKFTPLMERAALLGFPKVATGHYARAGFDRETGRWLLRKALDDSKDQSYVLYGLTQEELSKTLFPLGDLDKKEVRRLASERGLVNAEKPDSQDICFVMNGKYQDFLEAIGAGGPPGDIVTLSGAVIGGHKGVHRYTVGQRRGIDIPASRRLYVIAVDAVANTVTVGPEDDLFFKEAIVSELNLVSIGKLSAPMEVEAKIRYRQAQFPAIIEPWEGGRVKLIFKEPQRAVAPGQAAVFYQGDLVVGGGTIERAC